MSKHVPSTIQRTAMSLTPTSTVELQSLLDNLRILPDFARDKSADDETTRRIAAWNDRASVVLSALLDRISDERSLPKTAALIAAVSPLSFDCGGGPWTSPKSSQLASGAPHLVRATVH